MSTPRTWLRYENWTRALVSSHSAVLGGLLLFYRACFCFSSHLVAATLTLTQALSKDGIAFDSSVFYTAGYDSPYRLVRQGERERERERERESVCVCVCVREYI